MTVRDDGDAYHYARDHYGDGHWCVYGPDDFYLSVPEKNLAYAIGKFLSGKQSAAVDMLKTVHSYMKDGCPDYLKEPTFIKKRRDKPFNPDPDTLGMKDRIEQRLKQGWSSMNQTLEGVVLEEMLKPTPGMIYAAKDWQDAVTLDDGIWRPMIRAALEGK